LQAVKAVIANFNQRRNKNMNNEEVINITETFEELGHSSQEYADRFKELLDCYAFCNEEELTSSAKELRHKLKKFCIDNLCC
jgi:hypothetical protein